MKHIFVIHSNITYLSALGAICAENLDNNDCILASDGYTPPKGANIRLEYFRHWNGLKVNSFRIGRYLNPAAHIDKKIDYLVGSNKFTLYMSVANKLARTLMTHQSCSAFHFLEEGVSAYSLGFAVATLTAHNASSHMRSKGFRGRLRDSIPSLLRGYRSRLNALPIFYNAYANPCRKFYGFTPDSHILIAPSQRVVMDMRQIAKRFSLPHSVDLSGKTIWLGDCVDSAGSDSEGYFNGIESGFIEKILKPKRITEILVKFHYREGEPSRLRTLDIFAKHDIQVTTLPDSTLLEIELLHSSSVSLYGTYSSLLLYASLSGNQAYSIDQYYGHGAIDTLIPLFWNYVSRI